jgi:prophage DNA circulation protein
MNVEPREEATKLVVATVNDLMQTVTIDAGRTGSQMRLAAGDLIADAETLIETAAIAAPLAALFDLTRLAGGTVDQFNQVRKRTAAVAVKYTATFSVQNTAIRLALVQCARILAVTTLTSRPEVDRYLDLLNEAFEQAETVAANSFDQASYRAINTLHAAMTYDLTTRGRPLPRIVVYDFPEARPALWIAQRLYSDAERADDLIAENRPVHPAFVQMPVRALSQ